MASLLGLFVVLVLLTSKSDGAPNADDVQGKTAFISQPLQGNCTTFAAALQDQAVTKIVLLSNYTLGVDGELQQRTGTYVPISRNITITGAHGTHDVLDLQFKLAAVELCATCIVTFANITVANERRGNGNAWDFFVGPASTGEVQAGVFMVDMNRLRYACTAAADAAQVVAAAKRPSWVPMSQSGKQEFTITDVAFQGNKYPDTLVTLDYAADVPRSVQEGRGAYGGYITWGTNVSRLCRHTVDKACLSKKSPDACVNELIDQVLAGMLGRQSGPGNSMLAVAIAVPISVVAALAVLAGILLLRRRRCRQHDALAKQQQEQQRRLDLDQLKADELHKTQPEKSAHRCDVESGLLTGPRSSDGASLVRAPLGGGQGWEQLLCLTSPIIGSLEDQEVHFGKLLGQGSFGRVYRARWAGREVAVKVLEHDSDAQATIQNEVQLMLRFNHPNIVRAFHCVTYVHQGNITSSAGGLSTAVSSVLRSTQSGTGTRGAHGSASLQLKQEHISSSNSQEQVSSGQSHAQRTTHASQPGSWSTATTAAAAGAAAARPADSSAAGSAAAVQFSQPVWSGSTAAVAVKPSQPVSSGSVADVIRSREDSALGVHKKQQQQQPQQQQQQQQHQPACAGTAAAAGEIDATAGGNASHGSATPTSSKASSIQRKGPAAPRQQCRCETWLVQEYCDCGTLCNIASEWIPDDECDEQMLERLLLLQDAAQGLRVLHSNNVVHGDLNSRNVLVSSSAVAQFGMVAKLADLGLSRTIKQHQTHRTTQTVGTMSHMPPELLRYGRMSPAVDVYAFGIMMWELYTGQVAFRKLHYGQFFDAIVLRNLRPLVPPGMPSDYQLLMERCWAADAADRPNIDRVLECLHVMIQERRKRLQLDCSALTGEQCSTQPLITLAQQEARQDHSWHPLPLHSCPNAEVESQSGDSWSPITGPPVDPGPASQGVADDSLVQSFGDVTPAAPATPADALARRSGSGVS